MKKYIVVFFLICFFSQACILSDIARKVTIKADEPTLQGQLDEIYSDDHSRETDLSETSTEVPKNENSEYSCQVSRWIILPFIASIEPIIEEPGWNRVNVLIYESNAMDTWGYYTAKGFSISTEGGLNYPEVFGQAYIGSVFDPLLPPDFNLLAPVNKYPANNALVFKVANTQNELTLHIEESIVYCLRDGSFHADYLLPTSYQLTTQIPELQWPTSLNETEFDNIGNNTLYIPNVGTLYIKSIEKNQKIITIKSQFTNANQGSNFNGSVQAYALGSDGKAYMFRGEYFTSFNAGPAQTVDVPDISTEIPQGVSNIKIIFSDYVQSYTGLWSDPNSLLDLGALGVFNLP